MTPSSSISPEPGKPHGSASASALQIVGGSGADGSKLTKEQKRFNQLVKKIKASRAKIDRLTEADHELRTLGQKWILPAEEAFMRALRDLVLTMHASPHQAKLTKRQKVKFREVMNHEITTLLGTIYLSDDAELRALFSRYSAISYEEMVEEAEKAEREAAADIFGMDLDPEDLDEPAKLQEKLDALEGDEQENAEAPERKKSKAQLEAESKRKAAENAVKKTTRQIYIDLVRHCHPDREQDELKRAEKTELMKKITAAYEVDDHLRLLEMQMTLLAERENAFADFSDNELKYFNESLQRQLGQLETELMMAHPMHSGNMFGSLYHPNRNIMMREMEMEQSSLKHKASAVARHARLIASEQGFRSYIADYPLPRRRDRDLDDDGDFFR